MFKRWAHVVFVGLLSTTPAFSQAASPALSHCSFQQAGDHFTGSCGPLFGQTPVMTLGRSAILTSGLWREGVKPLSTWSGEMTDKGYPNEPLELEVDTGGHGVLRTEYGWFPVTDFALDGTLTFNLDTSREVLPTSIDLKIVQKAAAILSSEAVWNRADNRKCPTNETRWSIYCALEKAEMDVAGGSSHRRPAAEVVRTIVDERTKGRNYHHRLMEYNNDPSTRLSDVQSLFAEAEGQIRAAQSP